MHMSRFGRAYAATAIVGLAAGLGGLPNAQAYTDTLVSECLTSTQNPSMTFDKGTAPYGTQYTYYSTTLWCASRLMIMRRKVTMKAGSGNGTSNACIKFAGWLPNGSYRPIYEVNHQTSSTVVKGSVWYLGTHLCGGVGSTLRDGLFLHSQGANGGSWTEANYKSEGCVKINQTDRTYLKSLYDRPIVGASATTMTVIS